VSEAPYSVAQIKLKSATTPNYVNRLDAVDINTFLDEDEILDDNPAWTLDAGLEIQGDFNPKDNFKQLVAGTGTLGIASKFYPGIYEDAPLYYSFDDESGAHVANLAGGLLFGTITGDINRIKGIVSRTINWDGATNVFTPDVEIGVPDFVYSMWFTLKEVPPVGYNEFEYIMYHAHGYCRLTYNDTNQTVAINFNIHGSGEILVQTLPYSEVGVDHHIMLEADGTNTEVRTFFDGTLQTTSGYTPGVVTDSDMYLGAHNTLVDYLHYSDIDEFMIKYGFMTQGEKDFLYDSKMGALGQLDNEIFRTDLSPSQIVDETDWLIIHGIIEGVTSKGDVLGNGDGVNQVFTGFTELDNITPGSFQLSLQDIYGNIYSTIDDGEGGLSGSTFSGTIDYDTGAYDIRTYNDTLIVDSLSYEGSALNINFQENINIVPGTYVVKYNLPGATYLAIDDGAGNITGTEVTGTINYELGTISLLFNTPTEIGENIYSTYEYRTETWIPSGETLNADYKVGDAVEITEAGVLDEFGRLLTYATFPPIRFDNLNYHIGINFLIKKLTV